MQCWWSYLWVNFLLPFLQEHAWNMWNFDIILQHICGHDLDMEPLFSTKSFASGEFPLTVSTNPGLSGLRRPGLWALLRLPGHHSHGSGSSSGPGVLAATHAESLSVGAKGEGVVKGWCWCFQVLGCYKLHVFKLLDVYKLHNSAAVWWCF